MPMPAYWIGHVQITDAEQYGKYAELAGPAIEKHGGRFLARGGKHMTLEGEDFPRNVVVEFDSLDTAVACYQSPDYQEALAFAKKGATRNLCIVEGA
jgi:uncharacterized protein (DUF1330 family)